MNTTALQTQIETLIWRWALAELAFGIIVFAVLGWVSYYILKVAIRDGIREALPRGRMFEPIIRSQRTAVPPEAPPGFEWKLVQAKEFKETRPQG